MNRRWLVGLAGLGVLNAVLVGALLVQTRRAQPRMDLRTPYQAVLLTNGLAYFGKLERGGSAYPVLRDVYYIQSQVDQQTKQVANTLVKRGKEWHGPDAMILNATHILFIEPVSPDSQVAKLIEDAQKK